MREAKRRYWESDPRYEGWIFSEPEKSTEDEFFASLEDEPEDLMPEIFLAMRCLTPKQRFVIECRYGIGTRTNGRQMNVDEIGGVGG